MGQYGSHWADFHENLYFIIFRKSVEKIQVATKSEKMTGTLDEHQHTFLITTRSMILRMKNVSHTFVEKIKTHIYVQQLFENRALYKIIWKKYRKAGQYGACA
jgi:hypothetical protein